MDVTLEVEFVGAIRKEYPPAASALLDATLPQAPLLDWLSVKGYRVDAEPFASDFAVQVRRHDDPEKIVSLTTAETFPLALHQAVWELMSALVPEPNEVRP